MTQSEIVKRELMLIMDGGVTDKHEMYNLVVEKTNCPRPTVRRVARALRNDLLKKVEILSANSAEYDCPQCGEKKVIKLSDSRCPKCKVQLDWSDEL